MTSLTTMALVEESSQVAPARALAVAGAQDAGLPTAEADRIALAATELAENLHRHAVGGALLVQTGEGTVTLLAVDHGPGVAAFDRCLQDGWTTTGTMGNGLGAVVRLATVFDACSEPGTGTVVRASFGERKQYAPFDVGAVGVPIRGEERNGDGWQAHVQGDRLVVLVADGLGHGDLAADASDLAVRALPARSPSGPRQLVEQVARALERSRGAAVSVAELGLEAALDGGEVVTAGLGNVSLLVGGPDGSSKRIATSYGTAGGRTGTPVEMRAPFPAGGVLVLHSDGLTSRWDLRERRELLRHSATVIAAALWRDHVRGTDDSMVLVARAATEEAP